MKPPNSGHFGDSHYVRSREVVPFSEVAYEATPTDSNHNIMHIGAMGVWFTANCMHAELVDRVDEAAKRALVDKET